MEFTVEIKVIDQKDGFFLAKVIESNNEDLIGNTSFARSEKKAVAFLLDQIAQSLKK